MTSPEITDAAVEAAATRMKARAREAGRSLTFTEAKYLAKVAIEAASEASAAFRAALTAALPHLAAGRAEAVAAPAAQDDEDRCIACDKPFKPGDMVLNDVSGGSIHIECCGPDRESYVGPGDPFPKGYAWQPAPAAEAEPVAWMLRHKSDGNSWLYRSKKAAEAEQRPCHILTPLYAAPSASQEALREAAYDQGRRDLLNALLEPNPAVEAKLAKWADKKPDPEGRIHFDVALWITEVAEQLGIKSQEELAEIAALAQSAPVKGGE